MARLCDVGGMEVVVVLDLLKVVVLQGHQETQQGRTRDLERSQQVSLLEDPVQTRSSSACHVGPLALERLIIFEQF